MKFTPDFEKQSLSGRETLSVRKSEKRESILDQEDKLKALYEKLTGVYRNRPEIASFVGIMADNPRVADSYTATAIAKDETRVEEALLEIEKINVYHTRGNPEEMQYKEKIFKQSELLQAMVVDRLNKHWFKDCRAIMTSVFDDLMVGIDAVMKHKHGGYLGASFDFTIGRDDTVKKKLEAQWEKTKKGSVAKIKYFEDPDTGKKGSLIVPRFIIGASRRDLEELAEAYLADDTETLENHPFKYIMLKQLEEQLQTALDFFKSEGADSTYKFAKEKYEDIENMLLALKNEAGFAEKIKDPEISQRLEESVAYKEMKKFRADKQTAGGS